MPQHSSITVSIDSVMERPNLNGCLPSDFATENRLVVLMRGLPSCGKSTTARHIAGDQGIVIETDAYFQLGPGPENYFFNKDKLDEARAWTLCQFRDALLNDLSPIVIDRGNGLNHASKQYTDLAMDFGYSLRLQEPISPWWTEIRTLLRYRPTTNPILEAWAEELANLSRKTHFVKATTIRSWMDSWVDDLTIKDICN